ncbi:MAG: histidine phosphatase family protein [Planctomycetaceae bacterium]|nr:histidine phosphatase family protein [Planctomycetaceae bacterium]
MNVGFFRHGPAVVRGTEGVAEADRPLTPEGRKKTLQAAKGLRELDLGFDAIYTSPLPRALQTAEIVAGALRLPPATVLDGLSPGGSPRRLLAGLRDLEAETPLLVGHEPLLSSTVLLAMGGAGSGSLELKKAGLALLELDVAAAHPKGLLKLLLSGRALRMLISL